jgi:DNA-binding CsgD family transcriptional regulator
MKLCDDSVNTKLGEIYQVLLSLEAVENNLSSREVEILFYWAIGFSYRDIASSIGVSEHTVRSHLKNIYSKVGINSRSSLFILLFNKLLENTSNE